MADVYKVNCPCCNSHSVSTSNSNSNSNSVSTSTSLDVSVSGGGSVGSGSHHTGSTSVTVPSTSNSSSHSSSQSFSGTCCAIANNVDGVYVPVGNFSSLSTVTINVSVFTTYYTASGDSTSPATDGSATSHGGYQFGGTFAFESCHAPDYVEWLLGSDEHYQQWDDIAGAWVDGFGSGGGSIRVQFTTADPMGTADPQRFGGRQSGWRFTFYDRFGTSVIDVSGGYLAIYPGTTFSPCGPSAIDTDDPEVIDGQDTEPNFDGDGNYIGETVFQTYSHITHRTYSLSLNNNSPCVCDANPLP